MADAQFTQEVTQSDLTLAEAIELEEVPRPQLMGWNAWMSWRKHIGKRPTVAADGGTTHNRLESQLWRATMESLYGEEWLEDLNEQGGGPDPFVFARPSAARRSAAALRDGRDTPPSVGAPANAAVTTPDPRSPVSRSPPANGSPGSGQADSWDSQSPGTPGGLGERAGRPYDPFRETYEAYESRLKRQAEILDASGFSIPPEEISHRLGKAKFHAQAVEVSQGDQQKIIKELRKEFAVAILEMTDQRGQEKYRILTELLSEYGVELDDIKEKLARGVPIVTPSPPKDPMAGAGAETPTGRDQFQIHTPDGVPQFPNLAGAPNAPAPIRPPVPFSEYDEIKRRLEAMEIKQVAQQLHTP